jgi:hypothetical protein
MKPQQNSFKEKDYQELHTHKGTENYEVVEIIQKHKDGDYFEQDTINNNLYVNSFFQPVEGKREGIEHERLLLDVFGNIMDKSTAESILKDGTMWNRKYYRNWIINGDKTTHKIIDPFTNKEINNPYKFIAKEKNYKKWLEKFNETYHKATYVYENYGMYYLKVKEQWYFMENTFKKERENFTETYINKEEQEVRMIALKDLAPSFGVPPEKRDSTLLKEIKYKSERFEKSNRGSGFNFSAGWWYLDIYMPKGDTIKIKRYADFRKPLLQLYKIPKEHGGSEEILFIIQKPEQDFLEKQVGSMYVIRPKNYKELPEYKPFLEKEKKEKLRKRRSLLNNNE